VCAGRRRVSGAAATDWRLLSSLEPTVEGALLDLPAAAEADSRAATVLDSAFQGSGIYAEQPGCCEERKEAEFQLDLWTGKIRPTSGLGATNAPLPIRLSHTTLQELPRFASELQRTTGSKPCLSAAAAPMAIVAGGACRVVKTMLLKAVTCVCQPVTQAAKAVVGYLSSGPGRSVGGMRTEGRKSGGRPCSHFRSPAQP